MKQVIDCKTEQIASYLDFNVKDFSLQINGLSQQGDTTACFIDAKNTIVPCRDQKETEI